MRPGVFLLTAIALGLATYVSVWVFNFNPEFQRPTLTVEIIIVNILLTSVIYRWLSRPMEPRMFVNSYLLSIVLKLIFFSSFLLVVRLTNPPSLTPNAVLVLCCYFAFTILEVTALFRKVGR